MLNLWYVVTSLRFLRWARHPGVFYLKLERRLAEGVLKGASFPDWWAFDLICRVGIMLLVLFYLLVGGLFVAAGMAPEQVALTMLLCVIVLAVGALGLERLHRAWQFKGQRLVIQELDRHAKLAVLRIVPASEEVPGEMVSGEVHWLWGPTIGIAFWRFTPLSDDLWIHVFDCQKGRRQFRLFSSSAPEVASLDAGEWSQCLEVHCLGRVLQVSTGAWVNVLRFLAKHAQAVQQDLDNTVVTNEMLRVSAEEQHAEEVAKLAQQLERRQVETLAWYEVLEWLEHYFGSVRTTKPHKDLAELLPSVRGVVKRWADEHMRTGDTLEDPDWPMFRTNLTRLNWPKLPQSRARKKSDTKAS